MPERRENHNPPRRPRNWEQVPPVLTTGLSGDFRGSVLMRISPKSGRGDLLFAQKLHVRIHNKSHSWLTRAGLIKIGAS